MSKKKKVKDELPEIRIKGVAPEVHKSLTNIAKRRQGNGRLSPFLKPHLRDIMNKYPQNEWDDIKD